ncbi:MAG: hypothetical protein M1832_001591 [Thelocarpon impressellum]|nr:MAG: hypothetical protein M1832_001591 [Thelocarpon impressellum]
MASSFWTEEKYPIHFLCAFCGGPFARVHRTDETSRTPRAARFASRRAQHEADVTHSIPSTADYALSAEELRANATLTSSLNLDGDVLEQPIDASQTCVDREVRRAYDGRRISEDATRWTSVLRALIHRDAQVQPDGGLDQLDEDRDVYLTGRGRVRQDASWADAYPSIHDDLENGQEDEHGLPRFTNSHRRFHMYQEPDRNDRKFRIASIPFHNECWDIMSQAVQRSRARRDLPDVPPTDLIDLEMLWSYLCNLIPTAADGKFSDLTIDMLSGDAAGEPITRLSAGCMGGGGYREAQRCGDGKKWLHEAGLHWLVVNPERTEFSFNPFNSPSVESCADTTAEPTLASFDDRSKDPFWRLPPEVLVETMGYLTCKETFRWRRASLPVHLISIPRRDYRRFVQDEMAFLPSFLKQMEDAETSLQGVDVNWKHIFEQCSREWRRDDGLRNRHRIWSIVERMADELVETSIQNLRSLSPVGNDIPMAITVARGNVGVISGAEGYRDTVMLAASPPSPAASEESKGSSDQASSEHSTATTSDETPALPGLDPACVKAVHIWLDEEDLHLCGLQFVFGDESTTSLEPARHETKRFGRRTAVRKELPVTAESLVLTGFHVCWYRGCVRGIQFVFEDSAEAPSEYCDAELLSPRFGTWDGPSRRLVAPRAYRKLAGVTGFINARGCIETFAILEEKLVVTSADGGHFLTPPDTVPLSHQETSLWAHIPPNDVELPERQGPVVDDWRLRAADCEVFQKTSGRAPPGDLQAVSVHVSDDFVSGIAFRYVNRAGRAITRELGSCAGKPLGTVKIGGNEEITAVVISHGTAGIHGLQLITSSTVGPATGQRYLGTQTVFAQDPVIPRAKERLGHLTYLRAPIIGFHCLYSPKWNRLVQLGLVTRPEALRSETPSSNNPSLLGSPRFAIPSGLNSSIPMVDTDELKNPWVDGAPPSELIRGRKNSDSMKAVSVPFDATFAGWINLRHKITQVVVYGRMQGLKVSYDDDKFSDSHFGNTRPSLGQRVYKNTEPDKRITCIARILSGPSSALGALEDGFLPTIRLLNADEAKKAKVDVEVESDYLAGIQVSFSAEKIVDWQPLFEFGLHTNGRRTLHNKSLHLRDHWKSPSVARARPTAETDSNLLGRYRVLADFFDEGVDGLKGYVTCKGYVGRNRFCGLRFRRAGRWDAEPLGQASPYEMTFLLEPGEQFTSLYVSETGNFGAGNALALCTSYGRTTPCIGNLQSGRPVSKEAPPGRKVVGIYMAYSDPDRCDIIGVIHDEASGISAHRAVNKPGPQPLCELSKRDTETDLEWAMDTKSLPAGYQLSRDLRFGFGSDRLSEPPRRAFALFEPRHLLRVDAYVNPVSGRYGLKALRFDGEPEMGTVLLGDWQVQHARPTRERTMSIAGPGGERIVRVSVVFHAPHQIAKTGNGNGGKRIIGLSLETNRGRRHDVAAPSGFTDEAPPEPEVHRKRMRCDAGREIVGFHYVIGLYVHDIGLVTREISRF